MLDTVDPPQLHSPRPRSAEARHLLTAGWPIQERLLSRSWSWKSPHTRDTRSKEKRWTNSPDHNVRASPPESSPLTRLTTTRLVPGRPSGSAAASAIRPHGPAPSGGYAPSRTAARPECRASLTSSQRRPKGNHEFPLRRKPSGSPIEVQRWEPSRWRLGITCPGLRKVRAFWSSADSRAQGGGGTVLLVRSRAP
jgi:hypothetical protein